MKHTHDTGPSRRVEHLEDEAAFHRGLEKRFLRRAMDLAAEGELDLSLAAMGISRTAAADAEAMDGIISERRRETDEAISGDARETATSMRDLIINPFTIELDPEALAAMQASLDEAGPIILLDTHPHGITPSFKVLPNLDVIDGMLARRPDDFFPPEV